MQKIINAVYEDDLTEFLDKLELTKKIQSKKIKCKFTKEIITLQNFHAVFPEAGDIKVVCNSPEAILEFSSYLREHPEIL